MVSRLSGIPQSGSALLSRSAFSFSLPLGHNWHVVAVSNAIGVIG